MKIDGDVMFVVLSRMIGKMTDAAIHREESTRRAVLIYAHGLADMIIMLGQVMRFPDDENLMELLEIYITGEYGLDGKIEELARLMS